MVSYANNKKHVPKKALNKNIYTQNMSVLCGLVVDNHLTLWKRMSNKDFCVDNPVKTMFVRTLKLYLIFLFEVLFFPFTFVANADFPGGISWLVNSGFKHG